MTVYLIDNLRALVGPVELPPVPGLGVQLPSNAIQLSQPLPNPEPGKVWVLDESVPVQMEDHRGLIFDTVTGSEMYLERLGPVPLGFTAIPRPTPAWVWRDGGWVVDPASVHAEQVNLINQACEAQITNGFGSDALGSLHFYSSQMDDQLNLTGAILREFDMPYACRDELGLKEFRLHTVRQLRKVGDDFTVFKLQLLQKANSLKQQLDDALALGDLIALNAVTWEDEQ